MGRFTVIPQDTFSAIQTDAGILLYNFDIENESFDMKDLICATTGGINVSCVPTYSDMGEDVDNCPVNMLELKHLDGWECKLGFTSLGTNPRGLRLALGAADIDSDDPTKIIPRRTLSTGDFSHVWWVGDRADGGMVAVHMRYALSTGGLSLQTSKAGKGQTSVELAGHVSIDAQDVVPMTFYSRGPKEERSGVAAIPAQDTVLLGKRVSELISSDGAILANGAVTGTLRYVSGFTAFSSDTALQSGNYLPFTLTGTGSTMTLKKNGEVVPGRENIPFDPEFVLRVSAPTDTFTVEVDGVEVITLTFGIAVLEGVGV